jgi:undecaprenyl-diphosphatase
MSWPGAVLLGLIQGLTEFLPVSSDGHLSVAQMLLPGFSQVGVLFDVLVHVGTLAAIVIYFRRLLSAEAAALVSKEPARRTSAARLALLMLLATIPTGIVGLLLKGLVERAKTDPVFVGGMEILTGLLLAISARRASGARGREQTRWSDALLIGTAQGLAVLPGLSRSASTISVAILLGLAPGWAAGFTLLIAIPAILGAAGWEVFSAWREQGSAFFASADFGRYLLGAAVAAVVGYVTIGWLIRLAENRRIHAFAIYCVLFGLAVALLLPRPARTAARPSRSAESMRVDAREPDHRVHDHAARERQSQTAVEAKGCVLPGGRQGGEQNEKVEAASRQDRREVLDPPPRRHAEPGTQGGAIESRHVGARSAAATAAGGV